MASQNGFLSEISDEQFAAQVRKRFASTFRPKAHIYWPDLLLSALVGWAAFGLSVPATIRLSGLSRDDKYSSPRPPPRRLIHS